MLHCNKKQPLNSGSLADTDGHEPSLDGIAKVYQCFCNNVWLVEHFEM